METTQQIMLRWPTDHRMNPRDFRKAVGFQLGATTHDSDEEWGWLFNAASSQPQGGGIATSRFFTGGGEKGAFAGIVAVGDDASERLTASILKILPALRQLRCVTGQPIVETDTVTIRTSRPRTYRAQAVVLTRVRGDAAYYQSLRDDPAKLEPFLVQAVSDGINRQAERIGLDHQPLKTEDVEVLSIGTLGSQPVVKAGREGMVSRLTQAIVRLPRDLHGDWRVGGLLTYGNGRLSSVEAERHYRQETERQPYPKARLATREEAE